MRILEIIIANTQGVAKRSLNEFSTGGDDGQDPLDAYPCYDCGSTIFLHHTKSCDLAEPNAIRDLPEHPGTQHWTGEIPKGLHPIPDLQEGVSEGNEDPSEEEMDRTVSDLHKDVFGIRPSPEWGREWMSMSEQEKRDLYYQMVDMLDQQDMDVKTSSRKVSEAPIELNPEDPMDPMIYGTGSNPGTLKYRMLRASKQIQDLAKRAENASAIEWDSITKDFNELKMNIDQIRHGLDELRKLRSRGGARSRGIEKF